MRKHGSTIGRRTRRLTIILAAIALAGVGTYAFTASNVVDTPKKLGDGSAVISGYTITGVGYSLNATSPQNLDAVSFTTSAAATTVKIKLVSSGSTWYSCTASNAPTNTTWSCATTSPQATAATADELRVVATE